MHLAIRQLYLQSLPEDQVPSCGPGLDYLLDVFPMQEVIQMVLVGDGSCAEVVWTLLGISIPGWTLVGFIGLITLGLFQALRKMRTSDSPSFTGRQEIQSFLSLVNCLLKLLNGCHHFLNRFRFRNTWAHAR